jgi:hypothetical protein
VDQTGTRRRTLPALLLATLLPLAAACATRSDPPAVGDVSLAAPSETRRTESKTFKLAIWEFDFLALDLEPRGTTFRAMDFKIFKVLEIGGGPDYHSFSLVEFPDLLNVLTTRHEGPTYEHRLADVQALALAVLRLDKESARESETHLLKIPVAGSFYGHEVDGAEEKHKVLYVFGWDTER